MRNDPPSEKREVRHSATLLLADLAGSQQHKELEQARRSAFPVVPGTDLQAVTLAAAQSPVHERMHIQANNSADAF